MRAPAAVLAGRAIGWRQGVVAESRPVPRTLADLPVPGWAAIAEPFAPGGTSGGAGPDAKLAALAEALERHAAARCPIDAGPVPEGAAHWPLAEFTLHSERQRAEPDFPYRAGYAEPPYTRVWTLPDNDEVWVPAGLVGLHQTFGLPVTSSGLAAGASTTQALLRATQELVERDAFTVAWLRSLAPRRIPLPAELSEPVARIGGRIAAFDLTPAYSPHPVVAVAGTLPLGGRPRATLGLACRADPGEALHKAWLEWTQGTVFLAVWLAEHPDTVLSPAEVTDFDRHAAYYSTRPRDWAALPWWRGPEGAAPPPSPASGRGAAAELTELVDALTGAGIRLAYRELTTPEAAWAGLRAVRVLAPELVPLHADHRWPHLGGGALDFRYPGASPAGPYPNPFPHPLG
ncbi:YcaO-like family protein [Amycolatopsis anabasis]|uniref:YcaO-like family protein n=1 Tax=Amycolatopsis anabasis TaxID=1840409 RepID=UPI00131CB59A|nr:YcaO-like family protein [Amycolatopsis anabasis]